MGSLVSRVASAVVPVTFAGSVIDCASARSSLAGGAAAAVKGRARRASSAALRTPAILSMLPNLLPSDEGCEAARVARLVERADADVAALRRHRDRHPGCLPRPPAG